MFNEKLYVFLENVWFPFSYLVCWEIGERQMESMLDVFRLSGFWGTILLHYSLYFISLPHSLCLVFSHLLFSRFSHFRDKFPFWEIIRFSHSVTRTPDDLGFREEPCFGRRRVVAGVVAWFE